MIYIYIYINYIYIFYCLYITTTTTNTTILLLLPPPYSEQRPHLIFGSYEYRLGLPPIIVSPLSCLYIDRYAPLEGYTSRIDDITHDTHPIQTDKKAITPNSLHKSMKIDLDTNYTRYSSMKSYQTKNNTNTPTVLMRLYKELQEIIRKGKVGYDGEMNEDGERHGRGVYTYANGEKYIGRN